MDEPPLVLHALSNLAPAGQCDCDCACALDVSPNFGIPSASSLWMRQPQAFPLHLEAGWQAYINPAGPVGLAALNKAAQQLLLAFDAPTALHEIAARFPAMDRTAVGEAVRHLAQVGLLRQKEAAAAPSPKPTTLSAWLHVTEACNLNCAYCYVAKRPGRMSPNTGRRAVERLVALAVGDGYRTLKLKYAGGEPTLNFPLVEAIHAHAVRQTREAGLALDAVLLTNAVDVSDAILGFLAEGGLKLMVSLDGGPALHNRLRMQRDGRGSHQAVVDMVERALERGLRPDISITLTALNLEGIPEAVDFALARDLPFSLNFYRERQPAGHEPAASLVPDSEPLVEAVRQVFEVVRTYPRYPLSLAGILDRTRLDVPHSHPCAAGRDYVAVDPEGRLSACQMLLDEPWSDLAHAAPLAAIRRRGKSLFQPVDAHEACLACLWRSACSGGCPLMRQAKLQDRYCQVYQTLLPDLVCLEANRLISTHTC